MTTVYRLFDPDEEPNGLYCYGTKNQIIEELRRILHDVWQRNTSGIDRMSFAKLLKETNLGIETIWKSRKVRRRLRGEQP